MSQKLYNQKKARGRHRRDVVQKRKTSAVGSLSIESAQVRRELARGWMMKERLRVC
jgi:hypothetical protein